jgi:hypothetical protein
MIKKVLRYFWIIKNKQLLHPVPRTLATHYDRLTSDEARIMARYGIRSPSGMKAAMKKHNVNTIDELAAVLEHHRPRRHMRARLWSILVRASGGLRYNPHQKEIHRHTTKKTKNIELHERLKRWNHNP